MGQLPSQKELESSLLAGAAALQGLVAERNRLRSLLEAKERELLTVHATNADLRGEIIRIGEIYTRLATSFVTQLHNIDDAVRQGRPTAR